jgi:DNA helicase-2/ATP-dependent DNA helicase PcrA
VKAAREMNDRLQRLDCEGVRVGTFHSLALQIVREEWSECRSWTIDDSERYRICVKDAVSFRYMDWKSADVTYLMSYISRCKAAGAYPADAKALVIATEMYRKRPTAGREPTLCRQAYETAEIVRHERQLLTFDDMLLDAWARLSTDEAARTRWAQRWDHVLQDEAQDENFVQHELGAMLARDHRSYTIVGDPAQCHPAGTQIEIADGVTVPIEGLQDGDLIRGWNQNSQKMIGGRRVQVAVRQFSGRLRDVFVAGRVVPVTPNHKFVARWTTRESGVLVTYLMRREGFGYRVGWCKLFAHGGEGPIPFHLATRARIEKADGVWILKVHQTRTDASVYESIVAAMYGLPTATFEPVHGTEHQTADAIARIFEAVADENRERGERCLAVHGLDSQLPLYPWPNREAAGPQGRRTIFQVHAANLLPDLMCVPLPDRVGAWSPVEGVRPRSVESVAVYSLQVAEDETYAANGIVVHNSIFQFRGANPQSMLKFEQEWGARVVRMGLNYRSCDSIIEIANKTLDAMPPATHLGVKMIATRGEPGRVSAVVYEDFDAEGEGVTEKILELHEDGRKWSDCVVLFRTNAQSRGVEESLLGARVPYQVIGGTNFYDRREVKDLLAYLRVAAGRGEFDDVRRSINTPFRYLGKAFLDGLERVISSATPEQIPGIVRAYVMDPATRLQQRQRTSAIVWCELINGVSAAIAAGAAENELGGIVETSATCVEASPARLLENLVADLRYSEWLTRDEGTESPENNRVSNVRELIRAAGRFPTVPELLDYVDDTLERAARAKREARSSDVVTLCSIHRSKGLEWPIVFVLGVNDKILPHAMAEDPDEERRLFYVACTRARDVLELSCVAKAAVSNRVLDLEPSRFLAEVGIKLGVAANVVPKEIG